MKPLTLMLLRVSLGLFLIVWGGDKLVNVTHALTVSERFYFGVLSGAGSWKAAGVAEILVGVLLVAGLARRIAYPVLVLITTITLIAVWKSVVDPLELMMEGGNPVFFSSLIISCAALLSWAHMDSDAYSVDHARGGSAAVRA